MKAFLLLMVGMAAAETATAQEMNKEMQTMLEEFWQKHQGKPNLMVPSDTSLVIPWQGNNKPVPQKPGVYALPQDNMPCIVPYTADIVAIPNAMPQKEVVPFGKIPNATPQTGEELRRMQRQFFIPPGR